MSDDLERAILLQYDTSPTGLQYKTQAVAYCDEAKSNPRWWEWFIEKFSSTRYVEVKFWCLQAILENVPEKYSNLDPSAKEYVRRRIVRWLVDVQIDKELVMIRNKIAQIVASVIRLEFPKTWPSFFHDLIGSLDGGPSVADMFCRVLLAIDSDIISLDIHRSSAEMKISVQLKDAMRETCIEVIVDAWYKLVVLYCQKDAELTTLVLHTLQKYISWMSVGLVVNNQFMPVLFELLKLPDEGLQEAAIDCLAEILLKGMEPSTKIHIVQKMGIVPCCAAWKDGLPGSEGDVLQDKCAKLLATLCNEMLECWKRVENSCISMKACKIDIKTSVSKEANQLCTNCEKIMDTLFPAVMTTIRIPEEPSMAVTPFLSAYILRIKHFYERVKVLPQKEENILREVLSGILSAARFPSPSEIPPGAFTSEGQKAAAEEETETVLTKRKDLFNIFKNIVRIHHQMVISTLITQLQITLQNVQAPFQDVEVLITAVFELGEVQSVALQETGCGPLAALVLPIIRSDIPNGHHQLVSLSILELYLRCYKVPVHHQNDFPKVVSTFVGERGIRHPAQAVSDRACYLFMRFVKLCKALMKPLTMSVLNTFSDFFESTLKKPTQNTPKASTTDDRLYAFEAAGVLLGIDDFEPEEQKEALLSMLYPIIHQIKTLIESKVEDSVNEWRLLQSLEAINRISKGFRQDQVIHHRPELGVVFVRCLELSLRIPKMCQSTTVFSRVVSFLHRMVELLGHVCLPYLESAFDILLQEGKETSRVMEIVTLLHQLATTYKESLSTFLRVVLPVVFERVWCCLEAHWDWTGRSSQSLSIEGVMLDEFREKEQLQRLYYGLIYAVFANSPEPFMFDLPAKTLQGMLNTVQQGAGAHPEIPMRRICFQIFVQMIERWHERIQMDANLREYVVCEIGKDLCLKATFGSRLDLRDAATHALFQDIAVCMKSVANVGGENALMALVSTLNEFPSLSGYVSELEAFLRAGDVKKLKDFFKTTMRYIQQ